MGFTLYNIYIWPIYVGTKNFNLVFQSIPEIVADTPLYLLTSSGSWPVLVTKFDNICQYLWII